MVISGLASEGKADMNIVAKRSATRTMLGTLLLGTVLTSTPAIAQTAGAVAGGGADGQSDIIVTAQKRSERLQDVPVSVTAIQPDDLAKQNLVKLRDYLTRVPGVSLNERGAGQTQIVIRGISTGSGNNPTVGVTIDDVPFGSTSFAGFGDTLQAALDPADLQQIEVLRGPQGTLYGASSMGGLLKYTTTSPSLTATSGNAEIDGSSVRHGEAGFGIRGAITTPVVTDTVGIRVSGFYRRDPGFVDDTSQGRENVDSGRVYGGRVSALLKLGPAASLKLGALLQNTHSDGTSTIDVSSDGTPIYGRYAHQRLPGTDSYNSKLRFYNAALNVDLGSVSLTSITGYSQNRFSGPQDVSPTYGLFTSMFYTQPSLGYRFDNRVKTNKFSEELRLASSGNGSVDWLIGGFFTDERSKLFQKISPTDPITGVALALTPLVDAYNPSSYRELAGFGAVTYHFSDRFGLQVGGRYSHNWQSYTGNPNGGFLDDEASSSGKSDEGAFTFLVTPTFKVSRDILLYARVASGYRAGGPNPGAPSSAVATFRSDRTVNYEVGAKSQFLDRKVTLNGALFRIDWSRIQIRQTDTSTGFNYYGNAGQARAQGAELSTQINAVTGLTIAGNVSYTDAKLTQDAPPVSVYAFDGDRLPYVGKVSVNGSVDYEAPISATTNAFGGATIAYTDGRRTDFVTRSTQQRFYMPAFTTVDLRLGLSTDKWTATLFARNIGGSRGLLSSSPRNGITRAGTFGATLIQPRTIGASLSTKF
jgi:outer membrane receptor protein involved in Fe transport